MPRWLSLLVFFVPVLSLLATAHVYLYRRLVRDQTARRGLRLGAQALFGFGFLGAVGFRFLGALFPSEFVRILGIGLLVWMGLVLYLLLFTLAVELVQRAVRWRVRRAAAPLEQPSQPPSPERRAILTGGLAVGAGLAGAGVSTFGAWRAFHPPDVRDTPVRLPRLPRALDGFSLVQLTDIHVGDVLQRHFVDELVARTNALKPDVIAITGDLVDGSVESLGAFVAGFGRLRARNGVFFVTGNHDYYSGASSWVAFLETLGITVLRNRAVSIGDTGASFMLAGVDDWSAARMGEPGYDLDAALRGVSPDRASVLLAHQPSNFDEVARRGVGLQLSGHTHGGQMFPGNLVGDAIWGSRNAGLSRTGDSQLYVSRGCGFVGPPMRVGAPPEIARLVLLPG
ncbi:metallophosphoesterase [Myxococcus sp. CA051A]|uniref:Metallophosphoesterase n=1 Tax=Myxococcus llanfairpwllgwyngyllgogerychwyrndrobwllllantysiliogogogochensis TaxID=2590453 RepID=A0A540WUN3_9BACT|nr:MULTISPECIES: metallophosphoesterase [Myxococcus]NTX64022.1 metallophosphoesterase [Myxococcus sp. CA051A]TQF12640.1 metallophosphoesterase [Myxococcus llanfairpwllgwyngyllgogerychwyrndrobwllllantysiliogogogochensis]